jgi:hypothetical protein
MSLFPEGRFPAVVAIQNTEHGPMAVQWSKAGTGTVQAVVQFEVLRGPEARRRISWFGSLTEKSEDFTLKALRTCGFTGADIDKFYAQQPENEVELVVRHEEYNGKIRAKVAFINDPQGGVKIEHPIQGAELKKFAAQLKNKLKSIPEVKGTAAVREEPSAAPAGERPDDDVPPPTGDEGETRVDDDQIPF